MKEYKSYNGTIQIFENGEYVESISKDDSVSLLNALQYRLEMYELKIQEDARALARYKKQSSDDRWALDYARGINQMGQ